MGRSKVMLLSEAVAGVPDGANMIFGGFAAYFTPLAFVREMIRQGKRRIEMTSVAGCWAADYLAGAGILKRARLSNFMFERQGRCYNFCRGGERARSPWRTAATSPSRPAWWRPASASPSCRSSPWRGPI